MTEIEICTVSGYSEIGRNMSAVRVDDEVILLDMGLHLDNYIETVGEDEPTKYSKELLIKKGAIPDDSSIKDWKDKVKAIVLTHAHLDHIGAVPYLANHYDCPIIGTPFTVEILKAIVKDNNFSLKNTIKQLSVNAKYQISKNITIELINVTHSIPQTAIIAIHTPKGTVMYANDFKFDMFPVLGMKASPERFKKIENVLVLIVDSLYADKEMKTPSESVAKAMLKDVLIGTNSENRAILVSTFSSHIARLSSIVKYGKRLGRKI
ncbi:MBL fold metallo-hydrolase, partial [Candidatus Woesearchaeota archaeon]|nr:MBL fold metallo-hydrolase [Candidatus Woesearchaeota archaeon]